MNNDDHQDNEPTTLKRRELLKKTGAAGGGVLLAQAATGAFDEEAWASGAAKMPQRVLGKTGKKVPILLMGGSMSWDTKWDPKLPEAMRHGINYMDAAYVYTGGKNEQAVGSFLKRTGARKKMWITSKSDLFDPDGFESRLKESIARMHCDYVDLYFLHGIDDPAVLTPELKARVDKLKQAGLMRHFGFSCHDGNVAGLLHAAAKTPWVEVVMFRYNFRQYGNETLNRAIDAAHKANVGLIAMKTQGSAFSFEKEWQKFQQKGKWNKHQAVLKAVWEDKRITAAVSQMDSLEKIRENAAAAHDQTKLGALEWQELKRYARATQEIACDGCDHICSQHIQAPIPVSATLRYLMYAEGYAERAEAKRLYRALPEAARAVDDVDFSAASAACPHRIDLDKHLRTAKRVLGGDESDELAEGQVPA